MGKCGKTNPVSNRKKISSTRQKIRYNLSHPRIGYQERNYIYSTLKMVDWYVLNKKRMIRFEGKGRKPTSFIQPQKLSQSLSQKPFILRESDKKMGWAFNSVIWSKEEYRRPLRTSSYRWVWKMDVVDDLKRGYRKEIMVILSVVYCRGN